MAEPIRSTGKNIAPNRFMLSFGTKYAETHAHIVKDAAADDREPGEYLVRWLAKNYKSEE